MSVELQKGSAFITRLLANPIMKGCSPLQMEEQLIQFLQVNSRQLFPTLSSGAFYPGKSWPQIFSILMTAMVHEINKRLFPIIEDIVDRRINMSFIPFLRQQHAPLKDVKEELKKFLYQTLQKPGARPSFIGAINALMHNLSDKYLEMIYIRRKYIHFELTKVQRLKMSKEEVKDLVKVSLLLRPSIHMLSISGMEPQESAGTVVQNQFAEKVFHSAKGQLKLLPEPALKSALNSNLSFNDNKFIEATGRITSIIASRCRNYRANIKIDRGAETSDKSWFSIARRNFRFYGFDIKMLDEFHNIAAENGW